MKVTELSYNGQDDLMFEIEEAVENKKKIVFLEDVKDIDETLFDEMEKMEQNFFLSWNKNYEIDFRDEKEIKHTIQKKGKVTKLEDEKAMIFLMNHRPFTRAFYIEK